MAIRKPAKIRAISQAGIPGLSDVISVTGSTSLVASGVGLGADVKATVGKAVGVANVAGGGVGLSVGAGVAIGAGVGTASDIGFGMGVGVAVGVDICVGVNTAVGTAVGAGVRVAVGTSVGVGVCVTVGSGVGVGVGSGVRVGVGFGDGGLATDTSMVTVTLNPATSFAVMTNDAVPASRGVMDRILASTTAEATSNSASSTNVKVRMSPSGSAKNSLRSKVVGELPAVNPVMGIAVPTVLAGPSFTSVTETVTSSCWDTGGLPSSVATTVRT